MKLLALLLLVSSLPVSGQITTNRDGVRIFKLKRPAPIFTNQVYLSPNNRYQLRVEVDESLAGSRSQFPYSATMTQTGKGSTNFHAWTVKFNARNHRYWLLPEIFIADDGSFALIPHERSQWTLLKPHEASRTLPDIFNRVAPDEKLVEIDRLNEDPILRLWRRTDEQWIAFNLRSQTTIDVTDKLRDQWNKTTRQHVLSLFQRAEADAMRLKLREVSQELAAMTGAAIPSLRNGEMREIHFDFLALQRHPDDRSWFERLLRSGDSSPLVPYSFYPPGALGFPAPPPTRLGTSWMSGYLGDPFSFQISHSLRIFGDALLATYGGKMTNRLPYGVRPEQSFYLGEISGRIRLPAPILQASLLRVHLVPGDRAPKKWFSGEHDVIEAGLLPTPDKQYDLSDEISFGFKTVPPGQYMLKAIWDHRLPFTDSETPGPGDYQSDWIGPLQLGPCAAITNLFVLCDTPAAGAEAYYAADRLAARQWKETGELTLLSRFAKDPRREIFSAPPARWIIRTNSVRPGKPIELTRIAKFTSRSRQKSSPEPLVVVWRQGETVREPMDICILDEHGCKFLPKTIDTFPRFEVATFPIFPRSDSTWRLVAYGPTGDNDVLFDYTFTNHVRVDPIPLTPQSIPLDLAFGSSFDSLTMHIEQMGQSSTIWMKETYSAAGLPVQDWRCPGLFFSDIHGNILQPYEGCRHKSALRVFGNIFNDGAPQSVPFEFTIDPGKL